MKPILGEWISYIGWFRQLFSFVTFSHFFVDGVPSSTTQAPPSLRELWPIKAIVTNESLTIPHEILSFRSAIDTQVHAFFTLLTEKPISLWLLTSLCCDSMIMESTQSVCCRIYVIWLCSSLLMSKFLLWNFKSFRFTNNIIVLIISLLFTNTYHLLPLN